jgi:hypothetical protein
VPLIKQGRTYLLDGRRIPSVTDVLSFVIDDLSYLDQRMLLKAAERGTEVHTLTEEYDLGTIDWNTIPDNRKGYVDAYVQFCMDTGWEANQVEVVVCNERFRFAGTVDRTGWLRKKHDDEIVMDIKSGQLQPTVALQLAGYEAALDRKLRRYALRLCEDGSYELKEYTDATDRGVFLSAVAVAHWKLRHGKSRFREERST